MLAEVREQPDDGHAPRKGNHHLAGGAPGVGDCGTGDGGLARTAHALARATASRAQSRQGPCLPGRPRPNRPGDGPERDDLGGREGSQWHRASVPARKAGGMRPGAAVLTRAVEPGTPDGPARGASTGRRVD